MKVLIVKLGALGDVVMATPIIEAIARAHRADTVWLLTTPPYAPLFAEWPGLHVRSFERHGLLALLRTIAWVRSERFARLYDLQSSERTALLCALSGAPLRIGNHTRFPYNVHPAEPWRRQCHIFARMNEVIAAAGLPPAEPRPRLPVPAAEQAAVLRWLTEHGLAPGAFAVLHAGTSARGAIKRWPHFGELAEALEAEGVRVVWSGGPEEGALNARLARQAGVDAQGFFSALGLVALGAQARFAVCNDSGPMHLLAAGGCPVYGLFGPSDWRRSHALGQRERVIAAEVPCRGCQRRARTPPEHICLSSLRPERVLERLRRDGMLRCGGGAAS